jgi:hypothetical protein
MKSGPLEAELFHADGRTDRHDEASSHYQNSFIKIQLMHSL